MTDHWPNGLFEQAEWFGIALMWIVTLLRAPVAVRTPQQRPLWLAVGLASVAMTLQVPEVALLAKAALGGSSHAVCLFKEIVGLLAATAVFQFISAIVGLRRTRPVILGTAALTLAGLVALCVFSPPHVRHVVPSPPSQAETPDTMYWIVLLSYHLAANTACVVVCWRSGRRVTHAVTRAGLLLLGTGLFLSALLMALSLAHVFTRNAAIPHLFPAVSGAEATFMAAGAASPLLRRPLRTLRNMAVMYRLHPLWRTLVHVTPEVTLDGPRSRAVDLLSAVRHSDLRLYRRAIEIRDALLALENFSPAGSLDRAREHVRAARITDASAEAAVTACWAGAAMANKRSGAMTPGRPSRLPESGGDDMAEEVDFLLHLSRFFRSPLVTSFLKAEEQRHGAMPDSRAA
ncbi:MAB_1171c family putative transporter [Streptomyces catenulae]|uniref:MAB_1171c family putative transporter n=1 Tax=Streptomyces catenulae TaxID=66875 RepID=A0ABV2Z8I0_9ACTN|nr:MAB_1171c family putative transporter [Streptomyces catenulae]